MPVRMPSYVSVRRLASRAQALPEAASVRVAIECSNVRKSFGVRTFSNVIEMRDALRSVSFSAHEGSIFALIGHNGAGKTTTLRLLSGELVPTAGTLAVHGQQPSDRTVLQNRGVCAQRDVLMAELTVGEHIELWRALKAAATDGEASAMAERLGLAAKLDVGAAKLSGGQRRALSLLLSLLGAPRVLVLDEPTSAMDPERRLPYSR